MSWVSALTLLSTAWLAACAPPDDEGLFDGTSTATGSGAGAGSSSGDGTDSTSGDTDGTGATTDNGTTGDGNPGGSPGVCAPKFTQDLILLGELQFVNTLGLLFDRSALEGRLIPDAGTKNFSQKGIVANTSLVSSRLDWATHVLETFDVAQTGCAEADTACVRTFLEQFAHKGFRRPVSSEEIDNLMLVFDEGAKSSFEEGVKIALEAIILAPSFNHRTEYGADAGDGTYPLTPHELANTIAFLITDTAPDPELLAAADSGALAMPAERQAQVTRLLTDATPGDGDDPTAQNKTAVESTLLSAWALGNLFGAVKDPTAFPDFNAGLASQMYEETSLFLRKNLWESGLNNVLTSETTFVNQALAEIYGLTLPQGAEPNQFHEVSLAGTGRAGLLTQASVLTARSRTDETSVVSRGLFIHGPLLCQPKIPAPPANAVALAEEQLHSGATERELAEYRATNSPCNNCHDQFDVYGLLLENYDAIGRYRANDKNGNLIDPSVDLSGVKAFEDDGTIPDAQSFQQLVAERPYFVQCVTRHLLSYGTGQDGIKRDDCEVTDITQNLSSDSTLTEVIQAIVTSPALTVRVPESL